MPKTKDERFIDKLLRIIEASCKDCCFDDGDEVYECPSKKCSLWPYRMGTRKPPKKKKK